MLSAQPFCLDTITRGLLAFPTQRRSYLFNRPVRRSSYNLAGATVRHWDVAACSCSVATEHRVPHFRCDADGRPRCRVLKASPSSAMPVLPALGPSRRRKHWRQARRNSAYDRCKRLSPGINRDHLTESGTDRSSVSYPDIEVTARDVRASEPYRLPTTQRSECLRPSVRADGAPTLATIASYVGMPDTTS